MLHTNLAKLLLLKLLTKLMRLQNLFIKLGFSDNEARVYLAILKLREESANTIAKHAGVKRPTTYVILNRLLERGLLSSITKDGKTFYRSLDPTILLETKYTEYESLKNALPALQKLNQNYQIIPRTSVYEGKQGLIRIMDDVLSSSTELLILAQSNF